MITSLHNSRVQRAKRLQKRAFRAEEGKFLVEGGRAVEEALTAGAPVDSVFVDIAKGLEIERIASLAESHSVTVEEVSPAVMKTISATTSAPGIVAVCRFIDIDPHRLIARPLSLVTILGQIRDPGNAGTIIRTCRAAGVDAVFVTTETVDIYNPKLVRASAGALFSVPLSRNVALPWLLGKLGSQQINRVAADPRGEAIYDQLDMTARTALLVGNEAWGLPSQLDSAIDTRAAIPMANSSESLNVAAASAVLLFEAARQRRALELRG